MIPVSLSIKGIYSYQNEMQTIDFSRLTSAGIFGIFGKVGSGKSSILEAIMFALYGEIVRMNLKDNRAYNILNLRSNDFLIDFVFKNNEGNQYRFTVNGKRNKNKYETVKFNRNAYKLEQNEWIPVPTESAEEIIGLNYDNFRRTIIIPQGKFQDFLQLKDSERTRMMKELFRLHRYDLSAKVSVLEKENENKLSDILGQLKQLDEVSEDKIKELSIELDTVSKEFNLLKEKQKFLTKQNEEQNKIKELFEEIKKLEIDFEYLKQEKSKIEQIENQVKQYNYCVRNFKPVFEIKKRIEDEINELSGKTASLKKTNEQLKNNILQYQNQIKQLQTAFENRENLKIKAEELQKSAEIKNLNKQTAALENRIKKGNKTVAESEQKIEKLIVYKNQLQDELSVLKAKMPDLNFLSKIKDWYQAKNNLLKQIGENKTGIAEHKAKIEEIMHELKILVRDDEMQNHIQDEDKIKDWIHKMRVVQDDEEQKLRTELASLQVKQKLIDYSENLVSGEPCPVCGSTHHPNKLKTEDLNKHIREIEGLLKTVGNRKKEINEMFLSANNLYSVLNVNREIKSKLENKLSELEKDLKLHNSKYPADKNISEEDLEKLFNQAQEFKIKIEELEQKILQTENEYEKAVADKDRFLKAINNFNNELIKYQAQKNTLQSQIKIIDFNEFEKYTEQQLIDESKKLQSEYMKISTEYEQLQEKLNKENNELTSNIANLTITEKNLNTKQKELEQVQNEIDHKLKQSDYRNSDEVLKILSLDVDVEEDSKKVEGFKQKYFNTEKQLEYLKKQTENSEYDADKHLQLIDELNRCKQKAEDLGKKTGSLENTLKQLKSKLVVKQKLKKEHDELKLRNENIRTLKSLFSGSGFVNYVSSVYLRNLVQAANKRFFRLTGQKLKLELNEKNNFDVRDFLNGGKIRSVKTLSGGQTFQASLSLALALADNVHTMTNSKHNFFFLDEGFGMLDKDALNTVFETLKSLRKENRIVGIISHVEELQQEIETHLLIKNDAQKGSLIYKSWE